MPLTLSSFIRREAFCTVAGLTARCSNFHWLHSGSYSCRSLTIINTHGLRGGFLCQYSVIPLLWIIPRPLLLEELDINRVNEDNSQFGASLHLLPFHPRLIGRFIACTCVVAPVFLCFLVFVWALPYYCNLVGVGKKKVSDLEGESVLMLLSVSASSF